MTVQTRAQKRRAPKAAAKTTLGRKGVVRKASAVAAAPVRSAGRAGARRAAPEARGGVLVRKLRERLGLSQGEMARLMYVSSRTLQRLERGESALSGGDSARYHELRSLVDELTELIGAKDLAGWVKMPLADLGDRSVFETLAAGGSGKIWRMVYHLESGTPG